MGVIRILLLLGSVGAGKTTLGRLLEKMRLPGGLRAKYIHININHGLAYLFTRFVCTITGYRYIGNYFLTLWFNNKDLFRRLLKMILWLDILSVPLIVFLRVDLQLIICKLRKDNCVLILDEYLPNALNDYIYYVYASKSSAGKTGFMGLRIYQALTLRYTKAIFKYPTLILLFKAKVDRSINAWIHREKVEFVDANYMLFRIVGTKYFTEKLLHYLGKPTVETIRVNGELKEVTLRAIRSLLSYYSYSCS